MIAANSIFYGLYQKKIQEIKLNAKSYLNFGMLSNSIANDILKISMVGFTVHQVIVSPILIITFTILIGIYIKWVTLIGFAIMFAAIILQYILGILMNKYFAKKNIYQDMRTKQISNMIAGIKQIKLNSWEEIIDKKLSEVRNKEKIYILLIILMRTLIDGIMFLVPMICSVTCIVIYQKYYNPLSLGRLFFLIQMFNLSTTPLRMFFFAMIQLLQAKIGIKRMESTMQFPNEKETDYPNYNDKNVPKGVILFQDACFSYFNKEFFKVFQTKQL